MSAPRTGRHQATVESAPLLGNGGYLPGGGVVQDHPAFLRASHSPWSCLPQNVLVVVRGFIVVYLIATAAMVLDYELTQDKTVTKKSGLWFNFALISGLLVLIYHLIAFSWTYTHLYYPDPLLCETTFEAWIIRIMSLPHDLGNLRKQFRFTLFYTVVVVFAFMNTTIYWFVTRPHNGKMPSDGNGGNGGSGGGGGTGGGNSTLPYSDLFGEGWFKAFVIFNLYFIASIIMIIEMLFLNSIKRPFVRLNGFSGPESFEHTDNL
ncbi:hypothetical protein ESCO_002058 [Escovopsis weberi]|uniref:Uncharacterized protein n=1 Tax=Escovopsis weberi TaxID=150374 RepID=A0A0M8MZC5_ESCWE|nr:hypothetical protein ESCO_002058 [Escovopsis weberi]